MTAPAAIASQAANKSAWKIDTTHTHAEFAVRHLMISTVKGRFADVQVLGDCIMKTTNRSSFGSTQK